MAGLGGFHGVVPVKAVSSNFNVSSSYAGFLIDVTASGSAVTITMDAAATLAQGFAFYVRRNSASDSNVVIDPNGSETIDGATTYTLTGSNERIWIGCNGSAFLVIDQSMPPAGSITSGMIASGAVSWAHLSSGSVRSGHVGNGAVVSGSISSGQVCASHLASGVLSNFSLTSGVVQSGHIGDAAVNSGTLSSGAVSWAHLSSGAARSGHVGNAAVVSGSIASGAIGPLHLSSGGAPKAHAATHLDTGSDPIDFSLIIGKGAAGSQPAASAANTGYLYVVDNASNGLYIIRSNGSSWDTITPATGDLAAALAILPLSYQVRSEKDQPSGYLGINSSGLINSGYFTSGTIFSQHLTSGCVRSGHVGNNAVVSGSVSSGALSWVHLASGAVRSGNVADGAIASGNVASGSISWPHLASGAIRSGHISSGSVGLFHLASGTTQDAFDTPGGRLTLETAVAISTSDQSAKSHVYYTFHIHDKIQLYDGTKWQYSTFTELDCDLSDTTKSPAAVASGSYYDLFVWNDSGTLRLSRGPAWSSGTNRRTGAGTSELERVNGILVNKAAITNGPVAQRGRYVGSIKGTASNQTTDSAAKRFVWNAYNQVPRRLFYGEVNSDNLTTTTTLVNTTANWNQLSSFQLEVLTGLDGAFVDVYAEVNLGYSVSGGGGAIGIGVGSLTNVPNMSQWTWGGANGETYNVGYNEAKSYGYQIYYLTWVNFSTPATATCAKDAHVADESVSTDQYLTHIEGFVHA